MNTRTWLRTAPTWAVALLIALPIVTANVLFPQFVLWAWPAVDEAVLFLGSLFLGMILGSAGVMTFLWWRWEVRR